MASSLGPANDLAIQTGVETMLSPSSPIVIFLFILSLSFGLETSPRGTSVF
jgi:hypothetical protein